MFQIETGKMGPTLICDLRFKETKVQEIHQWPISELNWILYREGTTIYLTTSFITCWDGEIDVWSGLVPEPAWISTTSHFHLDYRAEIWGERWNYFLKKGKYLKMFSNLNGTEVIERNSYSSVGPETMSGIFWGWVLSCSWAEKAGFQDVQWMGLVETKNCRCCRIHSRT